MPSLEKSFDRIRALSGMDLQRMRSDPAPLFVLLLLPLLMIGAITPLTRAVLHTNGYPDATGAEQSVPGMSIMFSFMPILLMGASFFREHDWHTWDRLRASPAVAAEIIIGKSIPIFGFSLLQLLIVWSVGMWGYGFVPKGSLAAIALVAACLAWSMVGMGAALVSLFRTSDQLSVTANLGSLVLGGLSGAFMPLNLQPHWVSVVAPFAPQYWAMSAFRSVVLDGAGVEGVTSACLSLLAFGAVGYLIAALKFRMADAKSGKT